MLPFFIMTKTGHKKTFLFPTAYLPPVEFFAILLHHKILLEKEETFVKQTYRNRCYIYAENGKSALTVPLFKPGGNHTKTRDAVIINNSKWYKRHWRALETAYNSSPFFLYYKDELFPFFQGKHENLFDFNLDLIYLLAGIMGISPQIEFTASFVKNPGDDVVDLRTLFSPKKPPVLKTFQEYYQVFSDRHCFIPNLSIVDLIFNLGPEAKSYLDELCKKNGL